MRPRRDPNRAGGRRSGPARRDAGGVADLQPVAGAQRSPVVPTEAGAQVGRRRTEDGLHHDAAADGQIAPSARAAADPDDSSCPDREPEIDLAWDPTERDAHPTGDRSDSIGLEAKLEASEGDLEERAAIRITHQPIREAGAPRVGGTAGGN